MFEPKIAAFTTNYATHYNLERFAQEQIILSCHLDIHFSDCEDCQACQDFLSGSTFS